MVKRYLTLLVKVAVRDKAGTPKSNAVEDPLRWRDVSLPLVMGCDGHHSVCHYTERPLHHL